MTQVPLFRLARKSFYAALLKAGVLCIAARRTPKRGLPPEFPSNGDGDSATSIAIAQGIFDQIQSEAKIGTRLADEISGEKFEQITRSFVETTFSNLRTLRRGRWDFNSEKTATFRFEQYHSLAELAQVAEKNPEIAALLGSDCVIAPDVLVLRELEPDKAINRKYVRVNEMVALRSQIREHNNKPAILHASISCKWTLRTDRSEALSLIRKRKGRVPHIAVVTGEPLPSRLASLALGTTDIDCVYHFALPELISSVEKLQIEDSVQLLKIMVEGERLKDITDLPLDLAA